MTIIEQLARELNRPAEHIENVVRLLDEGNTIPFIARYRKEPGFRSEEHTSELQSP